ncbi:MAG: response regulator [Oscillospiraceae bacterium]|nr:response regulator [Oscillospiraceae bacterium]
MPDSLSNHHTPTQGMDAASAQEARAHFLRNIRQMSNSAVLIRRHGDGRLETIFASQAFADMMECSVDEAMELMNGLRFYKSTDPEDRPLVRSMLQNRVAYDGSTSLTIQKITARKNRIWCNVQYSFIDDFGEHYIYCTYSDVTTLKQHEDRLRATYSSLGNNFYHVNDRTLALFRVNLTRDAFEELKGRDLFDTDSIAYTYSESLRQRAAHFPIHSEQAQFLQAFSKDSLSAGYLEGKTRVTQVLYSIRRDGRSCFVNITAAITRHPLTGDMVAFITEQECNSDKVKETLTDKILAQQFDMVCYLVNGQYGITIGQTAQVKRGNIFPATNSGEYQVYLDNQVYPVLSGTAEERAAMKKALALETVAEELQVREPYMVDIAIELEGDVFYKQFAFYSIDPEAKFYILLKSDTTELQKQHLALNEQLRSALEAANQANVAKTAFLSSMSHEIRTPMNAIIGLDSIALNEPGISERTRDHLEKIGASARHLLGLINDILDMSRIESGRMTLRNEEFSFSDMLEEINTMVGSQCEEKHLQYECRVTGRVDDYYIGDVMKLKQVIINILGNAVKFTPSHGRVWFLVEKTAENEQQSNFRFVMRDTGIGMDPSYLPRLFDAFSQENASSTNRYGSTGLGLAITKNIVEMMNGTITAESEKGVGSTFTVTLSLRNSERKRRRISSVKPQELKVLVIDDDPVDCEHARIVLGESGIAAELCQSGPEALEMIRLKTARREAYNLILVDWKLPGQDGVAVTREIRKLIGPEAAVILLTAYNWDEIEEEARQAGVDDFIAKPLFAPNVLNAFEQVVENRQDDREAPARADLSGRRILLAEDIFINAEIMKEILKIRGMEVDHAANGQEAVDLFLRQPACYYDAILMDLRMPVMDGLKAAETIRGARKEDSRTIPIIALTANAFDEDVQQTLRAGMNAHLSKPVEPERVYETLEELIRH